MEWYRVPFWLWGILFFCSSFILQVSNSRAEIIYGTPGDDILTAITGNTHEGIFSYAGDDTITIDILSFITAEDFVVEPEVDVDVVAVDAGSDNDLLIDMGFISATAEATALSVSETPSRADASATAIHAGNGMDEVTIDGDSDPEPQTTASSLAAIISVNFNPSAEGEENLDAGTIADARATGIDGSGGDDTLTNKEHMTVSANADVGDVGVRLQLKDAASADVGVIARTEAIGIKGGEGDDTILHQGNTIGVDANAEALSVSTSGTLMKGVDVDVLDLLDPAADVSVRSEATAIGIDGGQGNDDIDVASSTFLYSNATATTESDSVTVSVQRKIKNTLNVSISPVQADTAANTTAVGIEGGEGDDTIDNQGWVQAVADTASGSVQVDAKGELTVKKAASVTAAMVDASTTAAADATGISGNQGDDHITNNGTIIVQAQADANSVNVVAEFKKADQGLAAGLAYAEAETVAEATAIGISGGIGADTIVNTTTGQITVMADNVADPENRESTSDSVGLILEGSFEDKWSGVLGGSVINGSTQADFIAIGIDAGDDNDAITNEGIISVTVNPNAASTSVGFTLTGVEEGLAAGLNYIDGQTKAEATAFGISGGAGDDTIANSGTGEIVVNATSNSTSTSIGVTVSGAIKETGIVGGAAMTSGATSAVSTTVGMDGGEGEDVIDSSGTIFLDAKSVADSDSVVVDVAAGKEGVALGATYTDATTTATSTAIGIKDSSGRADVENAGSIDATATAESYSTSVGFTLTAEKTGLAAGVSLADLTTQAIAESYGIDTAEEVSVFGDDTLDNLGTIESEAIATTEALSVTATLSGTLTGVAGGLSASQTDVLADASSAGLRSGEGDDTIVNNGVANADGFSLDSHALATASSDSVTATITAAWKGVALGASLAAANTEAAATAAGIEAGEGNDTVTSKTGIRADADAHVTSDVVTVNAAFSYKGISGGAALSEARTDSEAHAIGIDGGDGNDGLTNQASLESLATASTKTKTINVNFAEIGEAIADVSSTATTEAIGLDGGLGLDTLSNQGDIIVTAESTADDTSTNVNVLAGYLSGDVSSTAIALAIGMRGDADDAAGDIIENLAMATIDIDSQATLTADAYNVQGGGAAFAKVDGTVEARATGIASGEGADAVLNQGSLDVFARTDADTNNMVMQLTGVAAGKAGADLTTHAIGIDTGNGVNTITNDTSGVIDATAESYARAGSMTLNFGITVQGGAITAETSATGILSGSDADEINNYGNITVGAVTDMGVASGDFGLVGLGFNDAVTQARVAGINSGSDDDVIINREFGSITLRPRAWVAVDQASFSFLKVGLGFLTTRTYADGILGGKGDDYILNAGTIRFDDDQWMTESRAFGFQGNFLEFFSITGVGAAAKTYATGINGGQGNDEIVNKTSGVIDVNATAYAVSDGAVDVSTFGEPKVGANATTEATAWGIRGESGDDVIINFGEVAAEAKAQSNTTTDAWVGWGNPTAKSTSLAVAYAWGINADDGQNFIQNEGTISALADASTYAFAKADSNIADTESTVTATSKALAYGVAAGDDGNTVINVDTGTITSIAKVRTFDPQTGKVTRAESDEYATAKHDEPISPYAAGIHLGSGGDAVDNQGRITVEAESDARTYTYSNSWPNTAKSEARASGTAIAQGIAVGDGDNTVVNSGQIDVDAVGNAFPMAYSFSRDETSETIAVADAQATAFGIEGNGFILNSETEDQTGTIDVTARSATSAYTGTPDDSYTEAEKATAEATLTSTATGIATLDGSEDGVANRLENQGSINVTALAGVNEAGEVDLSAYTATNIYSRDVRTEGRVVSEVAATGILADGGDVDVINTGVITVLGGANAQVTSSAYSRDQNPTAVAHATAIGTAHGIHTGSGNDYVSNSGTVNVTLFATALPWASANSVSRTTDTDVFTGSQATAKGISVGTGDNIVRNEEGGSVSVESRAVVNSFANSDEKARCDNGTEEDATIESLAMGIEAGGGNNGILSQSSIQALAVVDIGSRTEASSTTDTAYSTNLAAGAAQAFGIALGDGNNVIVNENFLSAKAENQTQEPKYNVVASRSSDHLNQAFAAAGGVEDVLWTADAFGIRVGHGNNVVENHGEMLVESIIYPRSVASADTTSATNYAFAYVGGSSTATGILAGNGRNEIFNFNDLTVSATASGFAYGWAENYGEAHIGTAENPGLITSSFGINTGSGENRIENNGNLTVEATSTSRAKTRAKTVSQYSRETAQSHTLAKATGILTGEGASNIFNSGEVTATATAVSYLELSWEADARVYHATATARAIGIQTGSGDDRVENKGSIDVTADAASLVADGEAVGITTGAGNDIVINSGVIHTEIVEKGVSSTGIGIDTGAGNDTLVLRGAPQVTGRILGGPGEDLLVFDGPGRFDGPLFEFEAAAKIGSGTFTVNNMPAVNQMEAIEGTLEIAHDYTLASDGRFIAQVNNDGSHGQLTVDGDAGLAGELRVVRGGGLFLNGHSYDILVANSVLDDFDTKILPDPTPLLYFETTTHTDRVAVEAIVESSTSVSANNIEMAIAQYVDQIMPTATGELEDYLAIFQSLSREEFKKAFAGLSPESYEKSTRTSLDASKAFSQTLQKRMGMLRSSSTAPKSSAGADSQKEPLLLAYNGSDIGDLTGAREQAKAQRTWGLWLDLFGQWGDQETEDGFTGYDYQMTGGALGFDYLFAESFIVGLGLGHSRADVDLDQDAGGGDIESLVGSLYGSFFTERLYVDTALTYGQQDYDNYRNLVIGPLQGTAASKHEGTLFSANLGGGYYFPVGQWMWGPFGSLLYTQLDEDGFTENGAGALNLAVESREIESLLSWLGLRAGRAFMFDKAMLLPEASLAWIHDFDLDDGVTTAAIAGAPGSSFSIPGQPVETDGINAGASLSLISKSGYRASLKYGGDFRGSYTAHALYGEIRIEF